LGGGVLFFTPWVEARTRVLYAILAASVVAFVALFAVIFRAAKE
jgi:hypothetical protein